MLTFELKVFNWINKSYNCSFQYSFLFNSVGDGLIYNNSSPKRWYSLIKSGLQSQNELEDKYKKSALDAIAFLFSINHAFKNSYSSNLRTVLQGKSDDLIIHPVERYIYAKIAQYPYSTTLPENLLNMLDEDLDPNDGYSILHEASYEISVSEESFTITLLSDTVLGDLDKVRQIDNQYKLDYFHSLKDTWNYFAPFNNLPPISEDNITSFTKWVLNPKTERFHTLKLEERVDVFSKAQFERFTKTITCLSIDLFLKKEVERISADTDRKCPYNILDLDLLNKNCFGRYITSTLNTECFYIWDAINVTTWSKKKPRQISLIFGNQSLIFEGITCP